MLKPEFNGPLASILSSVIGSSPLLSHPDERLPKGTTKKHINKQTFISHRAVYTVGNLRSAIMKCPNCGNLMIKQGVHRNKRGLFQRYFCKNCGACKIGEKLE